MKQSGFVVVCLCVGCSSIHSSLCAHSFFVSPASAEELVILYITPTIFPFCDPENVTAKAKFGFRPLLRWPMTRFDWWIHVGTYVYERVLLFQQENPHREHGFHHTVTRCMVFGDAPATMIHEGHWDGSSTSSSWPSCMFDRNRKSRFVCIMNVFLARQTTRPTTSS